MTYLMSDSINAAPILSFGQVSIDVRKFALKHFEYMNKRNGGEELRKNYIVGINLRNKKEAVVIPKEFINIFENASAKAKAIDFWVTLTWGTWILDRHVKPVLLETEYVSDDVMGQTLEFIMKNNQKYEVVGWVDGMPIEGMSLKAYLNKIKKHSDVEPQPDFYVRVGKSTPVVSEPTATFNASEENVIKMALEMYLESGVTECTESTIKSTLEKFNSVWMSPCAKNKSLVLSLGEKIPAFCEEYGGAKDGIIWAIEKGLKQEQALRLRQKTTNTLPSHASPSQRRKAFIDEVNFFIELMEF